MLLPYYIAAMNIEHEYYEKTEEYAPFEGLCFADTLDMAKAQQAGLFSAENTRRISRERDAKITVVIGNPPYNVGQVNENDNNKNRRYAEVDERISKTYAKDSKATNRKALSDAYVKFFRWATDRLLGSDLQYGDWKEGRDGILCYVSNNSFVDQIAFDGMRRHLLDNFTRIWHIDLHGNVRQNPKLSGTTHNVFGIQVGVGITIAIRNNAHEGRRIFYHRVPEMWRKTEKLDFLKRSKTLAGIEWQEMLIDARNTWHTEATEAGYDDFLPLGTKEAKASRTVEMNTIFKTYSRGAETTRDTWMYDFSSNHLSDKATRMIETYNAEISRWIRADCPKDVDDFVLADETRIKWSSRLKECLARKVSTSFVPVRTRHALYRPFTRQYLYFDDVMTHRQGQFPRIFPNARSEKDNAVIVVSDHGYRSSFSTLITNVIPDLHLCAASDAFQCFPFYTYNEDGSGRRENITEWALATFRERYGDLPTVTKRDIFHYVYALLHHPGYRSRYAENLKRDLPRVPLVPDAETFRAFVAAGSALAVLHLGYETAEPYHLAQIIAEGATPKSLFHVQKMKLSKDKSAVIVNPHLTLAGIPPEAFQYRLGNRSALEWVLDQYQIGTDARSGIISDPNRPDDPEYIVRLVSQVVAVSVATVGVVEALSPLPEMLTV